MIIGFLGKGGSGKSTLSTKYTKHLQKEGYTVLAIDADHNMDLSYNLTYGKDLPCYLGDDGMEDISKEIKTEHKKIKDILKEVDGVSFSLEPSDNFTKKYAHKISDNLYLMSAGPQNQKVFQGEVCSHSLASPLKIYLPLLKLNSSQVVVVDEKASVDAVTTGIPNGFHLTVIVVENTPHSIKAGTQIAEALTRFEVPFVFIGNKIKNDQDVEEIEKKVKLLGYIPSDVEEKYDCKMVFDKITNYTKALFAKEDLRLKRSLNRYL